MRKNYVKPILNSEEFVSQEYVAACYKLICTAPNEKASSSDKGYWGTLYHTTGGCKDPNGEAQSLVVNNNKLEGIYEAKHSVGSGFAGGWAKNIIVTDNYPNTLVGETVQWETEGTSNADKGEIYHHTGIITLELSSRPNHS